MGENIDAIPLIELRIACVTSVFVDTIARGKPDEVSIVN